MKVRNAAGVVLTQTDEDLRAMRLKHVRPGDIFRYVRGKAHNIYLMLADRSVAQLGRGVRVFDNGHPETLVAVFPDAELVLGDSEKTMLTDGELEKFNQYQSGEDDYDFYDDRTDWDMDPWEGV